MLEVAVVVLIIAVLAAITFPIVSSTKERARKIDTSTRLHQVAMAISLYQGEYDQCLPPRLSSLSLKPEELRCVKSGHTFYYTLNYSFLQHYGNRKEIAPEFEPSQNAVVKAMFWHTFDCGIANKNCDVKTNVVDGVTYTYTIPRISEETPSTYRVLGVRLDGSLGEFPVLEDWEKNHLDEGGLGEGK